MHDGGRGQVRDLDELVSSVRKGCTSRLGHYRALHCIGHTRLVGTTRGSGSLS